MNNFNEYKVFEDPENLAIYVGNLWKELQDKAKEDFFVSAPLSSTPLPLYDWVVKNAELFDNWNFFKFILMDEQLIDKNTYVSISDSASYEKFAREKFLDRLNLDFDPVMKPELDKLSDFDEYETDLLILAIGVKGHYAQVMPGIKIDVGFHVTELIPELGEMHTKKGSKSYEGAKFNRYGMSLGPKQLRKAKNIVVMITGESKKDLVSKLMSMNKFDEEFPISVIYHPDVAQKTKLLVSREVV